MPFRDEQTGRRVARIGKIATIAAVTAATLSALLLTYAVVFLR